jgi:hypothetical protein
MSMSESREDYADRMEIKRLSLVNKNQSLKTQLTAERELSGALREALSIASDYLPQHWDMDSVPLNKIEKALAQYTEHKGEG